MTRTGKGDRYRVRIKAERQAMESAIARIDHVSSTTVRASADEWHEVEIISDHNESIGESLFRCIVDNGWSLSELRRETASLEDIFTQLTRGQ